MTDKPLGLKQLDFHADIMNICEPIVIDNLSERDEYVKKKIIEALEDLPKPKPRFLLMTPDDCRLENMIRFFQEDEISFKCELKDDYGFRRKL